MRKSVFIILTVIVAFVSYGCGKKQQSLEELQQPMSLETLATINTSSTAPAEQRVFEPKVDPAAPVQLPADLGALPPGGPYKPTSVEIQTALKNAGFYTGTIDGKIGPNSKKAIIEFQKSQGLVADGKVGPKTWLALGKYLNPSPEPKAKSR
jgi:murein L,D-transpeptidase YcbB/YkuD